MSTEVMVHTRDQKMADPYIFELQGCVTLHLDVGEDGVTFFFENLDQILALAKKIEAAAAQLILVPNGKVKA